MTTEHAQLGLEICLGVMIFGLVLNILALALRAIALIHDERAQRKAKSRVVLR